MALTKVTKIQDMKVLPDGQIMVFEADEYWEGGTSNGTLEITGPRTGRLIDVGDDVSAEDDLIKDTAQVLHSQARINARAAVKAAEAAANAPVEPPAEPPAKTPAE